MEEIRISIDVVRYGFEKSAYFSLTFITFLFVNKAIIIAVLMVFPLPSYLLCIQLCSYQSNKAMKSYNYNSQSFKGTYFWIFYAFLCCLLDSTSLVSPRPLSKVLLLLLMEQIFLFKPSFSCRINNSHTNVQFGKQIVNNGEKLAVTIRETKAYLGCREAPCRIIGLSHMELGKPKSYC